MSSHELRWDALAQRWVAIVGHRQDRPNLPAAGCPFCVGGLESPEPYTVRAFPNRWPALLAGPPIDTTPPAPDAPLHTARPPRGAAEVVLYSPDHDASLATIGVDGARAVVDLWAERTAALLARPEIEYVLVFENRGREVGATIDHPHGQIYAFPFVPPEPANELTAPRPLAEVVAAELDGPRVVARAGDWIAWVPYASGWPYGLLLAPRRPVYGLPGLDGAGRDALARLLVDAVARYDALFDEPFPYMLWVHQAGARPSGREHLHVHLAPPNRAAGTQRYVAAGELGSGTLSNPVAPEAAAAALRAALS